MRLYDSFSRQIIPLPDPKTRELTFYCCGPTVYGPAHIGNFRTFLMQDVLRRVIQATGGRIKHVRNLTDVDDKTIRQSRAEGKTLAEFTSLWTQRFHEDCAALNILPPHVEPGAVAHIPQQIALIQKLLDKGHAYTTPDGSVYFRIESYPNYGNLSRLAERQTTTSSFPSQLTERETADEYNRDSAADFALWKARKPEDGDNFWTAPWGQGRPGWHIECSSMCLHHLGATTDIHSGGIDLLFPHHENEIAQSEAATGTTFVRHWFHIHHLMVEGAKMSKSLGNLYTLADVQARGHSAADLRYLLISGHYRQELNFTMDGLHAARSALRRLAKFYTLLGGNPHSFKANYDLPPPETQEIQRGPFARFWAALLEDLNTPAALGELFSIITPLQPHVAAGNYPPEEIPLIRGAFERVIYSLGLDLAEPKCDPPSEVKQLAEQRFTAKKARDYKLADSLRDKIQCLGWNVKDTREGYSLEMIPRNNLKN